MDRYPPIFVPHKRIAMRRASPCGTVGRLTRGLNLASIRQAGDTSDAGAGRANLRRGQLYRVGEVPTCGGPVVDCTPGSLQYTSAIFGTDVATDPPSPLIQLVRSIPIDFSGICSTSMLSFAFTAGEIDYGTLGGASVLIGGTAAGLDGTLVWDDTTNQTAPPPGSWASLVPYPRPGTTSTAPFANPNPAGISWWKLFCTSGGVDSTFGGIRNYTFEIRVV